MRTNRKMEEKKMSMSKNIARLAVTAGLTAALSFGGVMAPVTMAFAGGVPTVAQSGDVTIKDSTYTDTTFKGIQIFKAKVTQDQEDSAWNGPKTVSDIEWASDSVRDAVTGAFTDDDSTKPSGNDAQEWAEWIKKKTKAEYTSGTDASTKLDAGTTLDKIAKALEKATIAEGTNGWRTGTDGKFSSLDTGYWLFVTASVGETADATAGNTDTFTSPIFAVVGGSAENLTPKKQVPTVTKAVKDDATDGTFGSFSKPNMAADSRMDQYVDYQLTGTVAGNINSYGTYKYTFTDKLPNSMTPKFKDDDTTPDVKVKIGDAVVASGYNAKYEDNTLTVDFPDLKKCGDEGKTAIALNGDSKVTVEYKAKLDSTKIFENGTIKTEFNDLVGKAQKNTVKLTYSNNPHTTDGTGTTVEHHAYDYTYGIDVTKVGSDKDGDGNPKKLEGVEFTLQEIVNGTAQNQYIDAQGVKHSDAKDATLKTTNEGKINVVGLDEGTYILKEVKPAPGYNNSAASGVTFTIASDSLPTNGDSFTPSCTLAEGTDKNLVQVSNATDGKVHLTVTDQKGSGLPLTGLNGVTFTWIAGGAVLCIGVAHLIRSRKQAEESEQE